jgi:DivIVA domain-containing protein
MATTDNPFSALDAIDTVAFKVGLKGYNVDEVDDFLERISAESRQLKDQLAQMRLQLRQASERISQLQSGSSVPATGPVPVVAAPAPSPVPAAHFAPGGGAEQVTSMIVMAQQFIEQAQQEAEVKAREMTSVAQDRAREIVAEARSRAEDEVNRLNGLKQRLSEDVDTLSRQLETERTRLTAVLAEFSRWVESSFQVGGRPPSASPAAPSAPRSAPVASADAPRSSFVPPPAPPAHQSAVGQVLNFEQSGRDERP